MISLYYYNVLQLLYFLRQSAPFSAARSHATTGHQIGFEVSDEKFPASPDKNPGNCFFLLDSVESADGDAEIGCSFLARQDFRPAAYRTDAALVMRNHRHLDFGCEHGRVVCCPHRRSGGTPLTCNRPALRRPPPEPITGREPSAPGASRRRNLRSLTCRGIAPSAWRRYVWRGVQESPRGLFSRVVVRCAFPVKIRSRER